jgi:hypothetical protein
VSTQTLETISIVAGSAGLLSAIAGILLARRKEKRHAKLHELLQREIDEPDRPGRKDLPK